LGGVDGFVCGKERAFPGIWLPATGGEEEIAPFGHCFGTVMGDAIRGRRIRVDPDVPEIASHLTPEPFGQPGGQLSLERLFRGRDTPRDLVRLCLGGLRRGVKRQLTFGATLSKLQLRLIPDRSP
jgi:hypothetical protein